MNLRRHAAVAAFSAALLLAGCASKDPAKRRLEPDLKYSFQVIRVPDFWPREKYDWPKDPATREQYKIAWTEHGDPDYIRAVYTIDGRVITYSEGLEGHVVAGALATPRTQWIYLDEKKTVTFRGDDTEVGELPDPVRILCLYGDPNEIRRFPKEGFEQKSFYYFNHGKEFIFIDDKLSQEKPLGTAMPGATEIR